MKKHTLKIIIPLLIIASIIFSKSFEKTPIDLSKVDEPLGYVGLLPDTCNGDFKYPIGCNANPFNHAHLESPQSVDTSGQVKYTLEKEREFNYGKYGIGAEFKTPVETSRQHLFLVKQDGERKWYQAINATSRNTSILSFKEAGFNSDSPVLMAIDDGNKTVVLNYKFEPKEAKKLLLPTYKPSFYFNKEYGIDAGTGGIYKGGWSNESERLAVEEKLKKSFNFLYAFNGGIVHDEDAKVTELIRSSVASKQPDGLEIRVSPTADQRLLTHEASHFLRCFANYSQDANRNYTSLYSAYEEGIAEMEARVHINEAGWFWNTHDLHNKDVMSKSSFFALGQIDAIKNYGFSSWVWYKVQVENPNIFAGLLNKVVEAMDNEDAIPNKELLDRILIENVPTIEGIPTKDFIERYRSLRCKLIEGEKLESQIEIRNYNNKNFINIHSWYYETFDNGSGWVSRYGDKRYNKNGAKGNLTITGNKGFIYDIETEIMTNPAYLSEQQIGNQNIIITANGLGRNGGIGFIDTSRWDRAHILQIKEPQILTIKTTFGGLTNIDYLPTGDYDFNSAAILMMPEYNKITVNDSVYFSDNGIFEIPKSNVGKLIIKTDDFTTVRYIFDIRDSKGNDIVTRKLKIEARDEPDYFYITKDMMVESELTSIEFDNGNSNINPTDSINIVYDTTFVNDTIYTEIAIYDTIVVNDTITNIDNSQFERLKEENDSLRKQNANYQNREDKLIEGIKKFFNDYISF